MPLDECILPTLVILPLTLAVPSKDCPQMVRVVWSLVADATFEASMSDRCLPSNRSASNPEPEPSFPACQNVSPLVNAIILLSSLNSTSVRAFPVPVFVIPDTLPPTSLATLSVPSVAILRPFPTLTMPNAPVPAIGLMIS